MRYVGAIHFGLGIAGVVAFLGTGQYMHHALDHLLYMPDVPRLLFRSGHIYLLMISLLHILLGAYFVPSLGRAARAVHFMGSVALVTALGLILPSFFTESLQPSINRPLASLAAYLALAGVLSHLIATKVLSGSRDGA
jgi:uncharacterized protein involved in cysteine biosynthesis